MLAGIARAFSRPVTCARESRGIELRLRRRSRRRDAADRGICALARLVQGFMTQGFMTKERPMNVAQCMTRDPKTCRTSDTLERAAQIMWENDCGCVPVLDDAAKIVGMITDRDVCMAAYTRGAPLHALGVASAMAHDVATCRPGDTLEAALRTMRARQVRRLPVLDHDGGIAGLISLSDVVRRSGAHAPRKDGRPTESDVLSAIAAIGRPRTASDGAVASNGNAHDQRNPPMLQPAPRAEQRTERLGQKSGSRAR
jgi:CBS domain-containing protein